MFVGLWLVIGLGAMVVVRRFTNVETLREHNDVAGFVLAVVGVVYAVLLAFVAIGAWERFAVAEVHTYDEANALTQAYRDVAVFPQKNEIRSELKNYVSEVLYKEWPAMADGGQSLHASVLLEHIAEQSRNLQPLNDGQSNIHAEILQSINQALLDRADRLTMDSGGLNEEVWYTLIIGGVITIGFALLFGYRSVAMQVLIVGGLIVSIAIVFYLTISLDYPFQGHIHVEPGAFENALRSFAIIR